MNRNHNLLNELWNAFGVCACIKKIKKYTSLPPVDFVCDIVIVCINGCKTTDFCSDSHCENALKITKNKNYTLLRHCTTLDSYHLDFTHKQTKATCAICTN